MTYFLPIFLLALLTESYSPKIRRSYNWDFVDDLNLIQICSLKNFSYFVRIKLHRKNQSTGSLLSYRDCYEEDFKIEIGRGPEQNSDNSLVMIKRF